MKRFIFALTLALAILTGCDKTKPEAKDTLKDMICGEWESTSSAIEARIYLGFKADGSFEMYQKLKGDTYTRYSGTWNLEGNVLAGTYSDGASWASSYTVLIADRTMTLTSMSEDAQETTYNLCTIPEVIKETASY